MLSKFFFILLITVASGCKSSSNSESASPQGEVSFVTLLSDEQGNHAKAVEKIVGSQKELAEIYAAINSTRIPHTEIPSIDFTSKSVAFVSLGTKRTGGHSVNVSRIENTGNQTIVYLKTNHPSGMATMVMSSHCVLVSFDKQNTEVSFVFEK